MAPRVNNPALLRCGSRAGPATRRLFFYKGLHTALGSYSRLQEIAKWMQADFAGVASFFGLEVDDGQVGAGISSRSEFL